MVEMLSANERSFTSVQMFYTHIHTTYPHTQLTNTQLTNPTSHSHTTYSHTTYSHTHNLPTHHLATSTFVLRGRRWRLVTSTFTLRGRSFCVAGVALGDIDRRFTWQAWHFTGLALVTRLGLVWRRGRRLRLRGRRGTWRHPSSFCVAGVAFGDIGRRFARRGTHGIGLALVMFLGPVWRRGRRLRLRGRCGTWRHPPSFCVAGVALGDVDYRFACQAWW